MKTFRNFLDIVEEILRRGETYGSSSFQDRLTKEKQKEQKSEEEERTERSSELYRERSHGRGIRARSKDPRDGKVKWGWIKNGKFTPDEDT